MSFSPVNPEFDMPTGQPSAATAFLGSCVLSAEHYADVKWRAENGDKTAILLGPDEDPDAYQFDPSGVIADGERKVVGLTGYLVEHSVGALGVRDLSQPALLHEPVTEMPSWFARSWRKARGSRPEVPSDEVTLHVWALAKGPDNRYA